ncbi:hypothetical protein F2Q68_00031424 [Brassica cretica]|uniref:Uncharacterized protein n=1 Tax=Brassica cretica TaxID=69181 RepID=A0A8S9GCB0_BRACR|nr:hypothetical protein F2Q68_00031424 [Brassica cretica]
MTESMSESPCWGRKRFAEKTRVIGQELEEGRYVATELEPKLGPYVVTELEPKLGRYVVTERSLGRYVATELFRNVDTTLVHAFLSTLRCYLPKTVANPFYDSPPF